MCYSIVIFSIFVYQDQDYDSYDEQNDDDEEEEEEDDDVNDISSED